ncbi:MAG: hypothetical protein H0W53_00990 [Acidobacteria bacterium]|nr:hypothetical protein [Acidobacteriota bacterium]
MLAIALLEQVSQVLKAGTNCSKNDVDTAAASTLAKRRQVLSQLWEDCDLDTRSDVATLASRETDGLPASEFSDGRQRALEQHGLATIAGNRMRPSCRLMAKFALQQAPAVADLKRLFGTAEVFEANIRSLLEHRLAQILITRTDATLRGFLQSAVRDLEPDPELALKWVRSIASRCLALIWDAELGLNQKLPEAWVNEWKQGGERLQWLDTAQRLPRKQGAQCNVLRLATGADNIRPMAKHVTKPTALLLDALQSIGDFAQHRDDFPESRVSKSFAGAIVLTALELVDSLNRDLARRPADS